MIFVSLISMSQYSFSVTSNIHFNFCFNWSQCYLFKRYRGSQGHSAHIQTTTHIVSWSDNNVGISSWIHTRTKNDITSQMLPGQQGLQIVLLFWVALSLLKMMLSRLKCQGSTRLAHTHLSPHRCVPTGENSLPGLTLVVLTIAEHTSTTRIRELWNKVHYSQVVEGE